MNITVNSTTLAHELRLINQVAAVKPPLPILTNVLISAESEGFIYLYATDLEVGFNTQCQAHVEQMGVVTLPAKRLLDLVEQLPDADVQIISDAKHVHVISGAFRSRLQTLPPDDFPTPPVVEGTQTVLSTTALQRMINRVRYAISDKAATYVIKGALLTLTESVAGLVATDGKRLSLATMAHQQGVENMSVLIPTKTLDALLSLFSEHEIVFSQSEKHLFFQAGHRRLYSRTIDGKFPAYQKIIPKENELKVTVGRVQIISALRRVLIAAPENEMIFLEFDQDQLSITSSSAEVGDAVEEMPIVYVGEKVKLCTGGNFLLDFLEVAEGETISIALKDTKVPLLVTDGQSFLNVIMLMKG